MFNLICASIIALLGCVGLLVPVYEVHIIGIVLLCVSGVWLFASFVNNLVSFTEQLERFEQVRAQLKNLIIYKDQQDTLIAEFKIYLADKYPDIEKEIFRLITDAKSDIHMILKYPEIISSKTLIKLVDEINQLAKKVYNNKASLEYDYAKVRFYNKNMWFYLKPTVPDDIKELL
jgi:hypothetical protein